MSTTSTEEWLTDLQDSGYRLTGPRRLLVQIIANSDRALSPVELFDLARKQNPGLGLVTVYRTLEKLEELELVQRVHQPGGCHMFLRSAHGHEHLLICTRCRQAYYFSGDDLSGLIDEIIRQSGYKIHEHWLQLFGLCHECSQNPEESA